MILEKEFKHSCSFIIENYVDLAHRQELKRYVAGRVNDDDTYIVVNKNRHSTSRGSAARDVYRHVAYRIKKAQERKTRRLKANKP